MPKKLIGLSVSICILRMMRGQVNPEDVSKIISATACKTPEAWDDVITGYRQNFWASFPDEAENLLRRFLAEGRVVQPRLTENRRPKWWHTCEAFVENEEQIEWESSRHGSTSLQEVLESLKDA